jgi:predicted alpha-1,6-mannanase (GH76 family)
MAARLLNGFLERNGSRWARNQYNDDIMWACMAFVRGYLDTGNATYRDIAKTNFDLCYARAWDTNGLLVPPIGGMYWTTTNNTKNACVNFPGAIAAYLLYQCLGDASYQTTSSNIYFWGRSNLFDAATGRVYDSLRRHGATTYNQGTFIGAANFLGQTNDAILAANFTMNAMTRDGILPRYGIRRNNSIFNAIFIRWMTRFMKERQLQGRYQPWLQANAEAAWEGRRTSDNLSWCQWPEPTPPRVNLYSYDCIASFEAMLAVPPTETGTP